MILLENDILKVTINPMGAELRSVYHKVKEREYMWRGDAKYWGRVSPVLFPIVGRVKDGFYVYDGQKYELSQHGFLRDQQFEVLSNDASSVSFQYESKGSKLAVYPFEHAVVITYSLIADVVSITWQVFNKDTKTMYYGIGGHPAFALDADGDYEFRFDAQKDVSELTLTKGHVDQAILMETLNPVAVTFDAFKNDAIIYTNVDAVELVNKRNGDTVRADFPGFNFVGLWTSVVDDALSPFICIEPWIGITDRIDASGKLEEKYAIEELEANTDKSYSYSLRFI